MDDRTLLERAAKAAGIEHKGEMHPKFGLYTKQGPMWNSLRDSGDALNLAIKLRMTIVDGIGATRAQFSHRGKLIGATEDHSDDQLAATRRAITRAAAALEGE